MNYKKLFSLAILILGICPLGWAQKKPLTVMAKAITGEPVVSAAARPYAQLLAETKALMSQTGYRPRSCINDHRGLRIAARNMTPEQRMEMRLAGVIARTLADFKIGKLNTKDPDLKELQALVEAHPNPRNTTHKATPYLEKYSQLFREERINDVYKRTVEFVAAHGARPRSVLYAEKAIPLTLKEVEKEHPEALEEIRLGRQIQSLFAWSKKYDPEHPKIKELRRLVAPYHTKSQTRTPTLLLEELSVFLDKYNRLPRKHITRNSQRVSAKKLPKKEHAEQLLGNRLGELLQSSESVPEQELPALNEIKRLFSLYRSAMPNEKELLQQATAWVAAHEGVRPRKHFFKEGDMIPVSKLSREQYEEILLARRIEYTLQRATQITPEIEALKEISKLPLHPQPVDLGEDSVEELYDNFEEEYF